jgi:hypothetical protein
MKIIDGKLVKNDEGHYNLICNNKTVGTTDVVEYESAVNNSLKFKLSLVNCKIIEDTYDLTQLIFDNLGGKYFYQEDVINMLNDMARFVSTKEIRDMWDINPSKFFRTVAFFIGKQIDSVQQNKWDVEVETKNSLTNGYKNQPENIIGFISEYKSVPKLDENGCLILKRK